MEIHKYTDILGVALDEDIYEGRMVLLSSTGAQLPTSAGEAALAKYLVAWPVDNRKMPIYNTYPAYTRALRYGFDQDANTPWSATVYTTYPGLQSTAGLIPSGTGSLLYSAGEFTVPSGEWVYSAAVEPGVQLEVVSTAGDTQGQLQEYSAGTPLAVCTAVDSSLNLRFRTYAE